MNADLFWIISWLKLQKVFLEKLGFSFLVLNLKQNKSKNIINKIKPKQIQLIYIKPLKTFKIESKLIGPLNSFLGVPHLINCDQQNLLFLNPKSIWQNHTQSSHLLEFPSNFNFTSKNLKSRLLMLLGYLGHKKSLRKLGPNTWNRRLRYTEINLKSYICKDLHNWQFK